MMFRRSPLSGRSPATARRSSDASDLALLDRVLGGDLRAFEALYRNYHPRLDRFLSLMTPRRTIVEEALNDTMLVVWERATTFNATSKVSTWIFAIAYRVALKALRTQDEAVEPFSPEEMVSERPGPEQQLSDEQQRRALVEALAALSPDHRCALVLAYFHDLPYAEIAHIVDCPVDTVKTRVFHGRRRLRALLQGETAA
jgi:RNA polymerase sigma-70 factor (ECF subfamily)